MGFGREPTSQAYAIARKILRNKKAMLPKMWELCKGDMLLYREVSAALPVVEIQQARAKTAKGK